MPTIKYSDGTTIHTVVTVKGRNTFAATATAKGMQVSNAGALHRMFDNFAPTVTPINISQFKDPTSSGGLFRIQATYADPPNNALNPPDPLADMWRWRVMLKSPRFSGGTIFVPQAFRNQTIGNTTDNSAYLAQTGDQTYIEVYLFRSSNNALGPVATTSTITI